MARPFSSGEAKSLIRTHLTLKEELERSVNLSEGYRFAVLCAADAIRVRGVRALLDEIPVEEVNREKLGLRVKALRDAGYETIADLYGISARRIAAVNGISENGAQIILHIVQDIAETAKQGVKLKLSADQRTPDTTALVAAVARYLRAQEPAGTCRALLVQHGGAVERACAALAPAKNGFTWLFSSGRKKQDAVSAYNFLSQFAASPCMRQAEHALSALRGAEALSDAEAWVQFSGDPITFINTVEQIVPGLLGADDTVYGLPDELAEGVREQNVSGKGLRCTLRRYQEWGVKYILHQKRVLLGDEMGLGKTVQAIAAMVSLRNAGGTHFLVVCPAGVLTNWCREIRKHSDLPVIKIHGRGRRSAFACWLGTGGAAVTTYETTEFLKLPEDFRYSMLVADEAHYIKNPAAKRSRNVRRMAKQAENLLFMTGTALENRVDEMLSLLSVLQPDIAAKAKGMAALSSAPQFREAIAPVYYRRKREDVLTELPDLVEAQAWCTLTPNEEYSYEAAVLSRQFAQARRVSWNVPNPADSSKLRRLTELIEDAEEDGRRVLVFSFFLDTVRMIAEALGDRCLEPITGAVPAARRQEIVDQLGRSPAGTVLAAQIQAGGTGLNIQAASVVILCEPQLKPSAESQAIARAYRMGQPRNVLVYRLLCDDTIDERILEILAEKQTAFDAFADESAAAAAEMPELDEAGFGGLIEEEIRRIEEKKAAPQSEEEEDEESADGEPEEP